MAQDHPRGDDPGELLLDGEEDADADGHHDRPQHGDVRQGVLGQAVAGDAQVDVGGRAEHDGAAGHRDGARRQRRCELVQQDFHPARPSRARAASAENTGVPERLGQLLLPVRLRRPGRPRPSGRGPARCTPGGGGARERSLVRRAHPLRVEPALRRTPPGQPVPGGLAARGAVVDARRRAPASAASASATSWSASAQRPGRLAALVVDHVEGRPARRRAAASWPRSCGRARRRARRCARRSRVAAAARARPARPTSLLRPYALTGVGGARPPGTASVASPGKT